MKFITRIFTDFFNDLAEIPEKSIEAVKGLFSNPLAILLVVILLAILVILVKSEKRKINTKMLTTMSIAVALSVVLNMIILYRMPQGGSVTLASMLPIYIVSFAYGPRFGMLTGLVFGTINLLLGGYVMHPAQVLLDYPIPFMLIGISGYFKNNHLLGMIIATLFRMTAHVASGYIFFAEYAPEGMNPLIYSLSYNGSFLAVDLLIAIIVYKLIPNERIINSLDK